MGNHKEVRKQVLKKVRRIVVKVGSSILASREKGLHRTVFSQLTMEGKIVFSAAGRALFICLERNLTLELIRAMAEQKPGAHGLPRRRFCRERPAQGECCADIERQRA